MTINYLPIVWVKCHNEYFHLCFALFCHIIFTYFSSDFSYEVPFLCNCILHLIFGQLLRTKFQLLISWSTKASNTSENRCTTLCRKTHCQMNSSYCFKNINRLGRNVASCNYLTLAIFNWLIDFNRLYSLVLKRVCLWKFYISPFQCETL